MKVVQAGGETLFVGASSPQSLYAEFSNTCMKNAIAHKPPPLAGRGVFRAVDKIKTKRPKNGFFVRPS